MLRRRAAAAVIAAVALWQIGQGLYIPLKAQLAQWLIGAAWARMQQGEAGTRPWPWADFEAAARLRVPGHGVDVLVLGDASARTLAFGPGWMSDPPWRGAAVSAVAGHRDTHFRFVRALDRDDLLEIQEPAGAWRRYRVAAVDLVDPADGALRLQCATECVALISCDRRRGMRGDEPLRVVVTALREAPAQGSPM